MKSRKGMELSLTALIIFIIAVIVLIVTVLIIFNISNPISDLFMQNTNISIQSIPGK